MADAKITDKSDAITTTGLKMPGAQGGIAVAVPATLFASAASLATKENAGTAAALLDTHEAAEDPHPQYTDSTELSEAISAHTAASNPHPQYAADQHNVGDHADSDFVTIASGDFMIRDGANWVNAVYVNQESLSGTVNDVNTAFTTSATPIAGTVQVFSNGIAQNDFTVSGSTVTMGYAPPTGRSMKASYWRKSSSTPVMSFSSASTITQYGITATLSASMQVARYVSGELGDEDWVIKVPAAGSYYINSFSTPSAQVSGTWRHGCMVQPNDDVINPGTGFQDQGFDQRSTVTYSHSVNKDPGATGTPLLLTPNTSIVKVISHTSPVNGQYLQKQIVITCIPESYNPPVGAFRPPVCGTNKQSQWKEGDIDYAQLRNLSPTPSGVSTPAAALAATKAARSTVSWYAKSMWAARDLYPTEHGTSGYGQFRAKDFQQCVLALHLNNTNPTKRDLVVALIQRGIDYWGYVNGNGGAPRYIPEGGGTSMGRKPYAVFAGVMLNSSAIKATINDVVNPDLWENDRALRIIASSDITTPMVAESEYGRCSTRGWPSEMTGMTDWSFYRADGQLNRGVGPEIRRSSYRGLSMSTEAGCNLGLYLMPAAYEATGGSAYRKLREQMDRTARLANAGFWFDDAGTNQMDSYALAAYNSWRSLITEFPVYTRIPEQIQWFDGRQLDHYTSSMNTQPAWITTAAGQFTVTAPAYTLDGGSTITGYKVRWRLKHSSYDLNSETQSPGTSWTEQSVGSLPFTKTGLAAGLYYVQVKAINAIGEGPWTDNRPTIVRDLILTGITGTINSNDTITDTTTGATAKISVNWYSPRFTLYDVFGSFNNGDSVTTSSGGAATISQSNANGLRWANGLVQVT